MRAPAAVSPPVRRSLTGQALNGPKGHSATAHLLGDAHQHIRRHRGGQTIHVVRVGAGKQVPAPGRTRHRGRRPLIEPRCVTQPSQLLLARMTRTIHGCLDTGKHLGRTWLQAGMQMPGLSAARRRRTVTASVTAVTASSWRPKADNRVERLLREVTRWGDGRSSARSGCPNCARRALPDRSPGRHPSLVQARHSHIVAGFVRREADPRRWRTAATRARATAR